MEMISWKSIIIILLIPKNNAHMICQIWYIKMKTPQEWKKTKYNFGIEI